MRVYNAIYADNNNAILILHTMLFIFSDTCNGRDDVADSSTLKKFVTMLFL